MNCTSVSKSTYTVAVKYDQNVLPAVNTVFASLSMYMLISHFKTIQTNMVIVQLLSVDVLMVL